MEAEKRNMLSQVPVTSRTRKTTWRSCRCFKKQTAAREITDVGAHKGGFTEAAEPHGSLLRATERFQRGRTSAYQLQLVNRRTASSISALHQEWRQEPSHQQLMHHRTTFSSAQRLRLETRAVDQQVVRHRSNVLTIGTALRLAKGAASPTTRAAFSP